jgi:dienelactone hydrolase
LLEQRAEVDPQRIGAMGYSMGSFIVALTGAVEPRLHACVLVGGGNLDGPGEYWDKSKPMCQALPYKALEFLGDRPAAIYALHAARGPTLIFNGLADSVVAIPTHREAFFADLRERAARLHGRWSGVFEGRLIPDVSHRPFFVTRDVAQ